MAGPGTFFSLAAALSGLGTATSADDPFRVQSAFQLPDSVRLSGESRARYESLGGQFRAGLDGGDQSIQFRTLILGEVDAGPVTFGAELQDARVYLGDEGTPLSNSFVDPLDFLQAYVKTDVPGVLGEGSVTQVTLGRQTIDIGSERQIERVDYANVIKSFTGLHAVSTNPRGDELHALYVALVDRRPKDTQGVFDNDLEANQEQFNRRIWGLHYRRADILPERVPDLTGEIFAYGLNETDTDDVPTANRHYVTPGFRLARPPARGRWDMDVEGSWRLGSRRASSRPDDTIDLDVSASQLLARVGYTFDAGWQPRVALQYYWASGDDDPADDRFDQYERLFGGRRGDLNNTSLHGPLTPANLSAPGIRLDIKPGPRWDARLHYSAAHLASQTDSFVIARLRDPSGQSGDFIGHAVDGRARYWVVKDSLRLEIGASLLEFGGFTRDVKGGPDADRTVYGYTQLTFQF